MSKKLNTKINLLIDVPMSLIDEVLINVSETNCIEYFADEIIPFNNKETRDYTHVMVKVDNEWKYLTKQGIVNGIEAALNDNYIQAKEIINNDIDLIVTDVIVQYAILGEVTYS